jgi:hypothetical protein
MEPLTPASRQKAVHAYASETDFEAGAARAILMTVRADLAYFKQSGRLNDAARKTFGFLLDAVRVALRRIDGEATADDVPCQFGELGSLFKSSSAQTAFRRYLQGEAPADRLASLRAVEASLAAVFEGKPVESAALAEVDRVAHEISDLLS